MRAVRGGIAEGDQFHSRNPRLPAFFRACSLQVTKPITRQTEAAARVIRAPAPPPRGVPFATRRATRRAVPAVGPLAGLCAPARQRYWSSWLQSRSSGQSADLCRSLASATVRQGAGLTDPVPMRMRPIRSMRRRSGFNAPLHLSVVCARGILRGFTMDPSQYSPRPHDGYTGGVSLWIVRAARATVRGRVRGAVCVARGGQRNVAPGPTGDA